MRSLIPFPLEQTRCAAQVTRAFSCSHTGANTRGNTAIRKHIFSAFQSPVKHHSWCHVLHYRSRIALLTIWRPTAPRTLSSQRGCQQLSAGVPRAPGCVHRPAKRLVKATDRSENPRDIAHTQAQAGRKSGLVLCRRAAHAYPLPPCICCNALRSKRK